MFDNIKEFYPSPISLERSEADKKKRRKKRRKTRHNTLPKNIFQVDSQIFLTERQKILVAKMSGRIGAMSGIEAIDSGFDANNIPDDSILYKICGADGSSKTAVKNEKNSPAMISSQIYESGKLKGLKCKDRRSRGLRKDRRSKDIDDVYVSSEVPYDIFGDQDEQAKFSDNGFDKVDKVNGIEQTTPNSSLDNLKCKIDNTVSSEFKVLSLKKTNNFSNKFSSEPSKSKNFIETGKENIFCGFTSEDNNFDKELFISEVSSDSCININNDLIEDGKLKEAKLEKDFEKQATSVKTRNSKQIESCKETFKSDSELKNNNLNNGDVSKKRSKTQSSITIDSNPKPILMTRNMHESSKTKLTLDNTENRDDSCLRLTFPCEKFLKLKLKLCHMKKEPEIENMKQEEGVIRLCCPKLTNRCVNKDECLHREINSHCEFDAQNMRLLFKNVGSYICEDAKSPVISEENENSINKLVKSGNASALPEISVDGNNEGMNSVRVVRKTSIVYLEVKEKVKRRYVKSENYKSLIAVKRRKCKRSKNSAGCTKVEVWNGSSSESEKNVDFILCFYLEQVHLTGFLLRSARLCFLIKEFYESYMSGLSYMTQIGKRSNSIIFINEDVIDKDEGHVDLLVYEPSKRFKKDIYDCKIPLMWNYNTFGKFINKDMDGVIRAKNDNGETSLLVHDSFYLCNNESVRILKRKLASKRNKRSLIEFTKKYYMKLLSFYKQFCHVPGHSSRKRIPSFNKIMNCEMFPANSEIALIRRAFKSKRFRLASFTDLLLYSFFDRIDTVIKVCIQESYDCYSGRDFITGSKLFGAFYDDLPLLPSYVKSSIVACEDNEKNCKQKCRSIVKYEKEYDLQYIERCGLNLRDPIMDEHINNDFSHSKNITLHEYKEIGFYFFQNFFSDSYLHKFYALINKVVPESRDKKIEEFGENQVSEINENKSHHASDSDEYQPSQTNENKSLKVASFDVFKAEIEKITKKCEEDILALCDKHSFNKDIRSAITIESTNDKVTIQVDKSSFSASHEISKGLSDDGCVCFDEDVTFVSVVSFYLEELEKQHCCEQKSKFSELKTQIDNSYLNSQCMCSILESIKVTIVEFKSKKCSNAVHR